MNKQYFAVKLNPSRPDFALTMSDQERSIMNDHIAYWKPYLDNGTMLLMGPVMDPKGPYGLGIVAVESEDQLKELLRKDPAAAINTFEYYPMMALVGTH